MIDGLDFVWRGGGGGVLTGPPTLLLGLVVALLFDGLLPEMRWLQRMVPYPRVVIRRLVRFFDRRLNRERRSARARLVRGLLVTVIMVGLAALVGWLVGWATRRLAFGWLIELMLLVALLGVRASGERMRAVARGIETGGAATGRAALRPVIGPDADALDGHGVARGAIELGARGFAKAVLGPALWYALLGITGALIYVTVETMDRVIGYRTPRHAAFGLVAARLDDALSYIPARLAALVLCLAAIFAPTAHPARAFWLMIRESRRHASPNAGWPVAALAGGLDLALGGPRKRQGRAELARWIGRGRARATAKDVRRALYVYAVACWILVTLVALLAAVLIAV